MKQRYMDRRTVAEQKAQEHSRYDEDIEILKEMGQTPAALRVAAIARDRRLTPEEKQHQIDMVLYGLAEKEGVFDEETRQAILAGAGRRNSAGGDAFDSFIAGG
jgi:hypothetical protein